MKKVVKKRILTLDLIQVLTEIIDQLEVSGILTCRREDIVIFFTQLKDPQKDFPATCEWLDDSSEESFTQGTNRVFYREFMDYLKILIKQIARGECFVENDQAQALLVKLFNEGLLEYETGLFLRLGLQKDFNNWALNTLLH